MNESSRGLERAEKEEDGEQTISGGFPVPQNVKAEAGGDPPISGGFPPPPDLKEEFPSPPSSTQGQGTELQNLETFSQEELGELDRELVGDGFTLSRLLGTETESPTNSWDQLSLENAATPPASQRFDTPPSSSQSYETPPTSSSYATENAFSSSSVPNSIVSSAPVYSSSSTPVYSSSSAPVYSSSSAPIYSENNPSNYDGNASNTPGVAGYRPWEAEEQYPATQPHNGTPHQIQGGQPHNGTPHQIIAPRPHHSGPQAYYLSQQQHLVQYPGHQHPHLPHPQHQQHPHHIRHPHFQHHPGVNHLPSFHSQFPFGDVVPPPNTQAPPASPIPTSRYPMNQGGRYLPGHNNLPHGQTIMNSHNGHVLQHPQPVNNRVHSQQLQQQQHQHQHQQQQQQYQNLELTPGYQCTQGSPNKFPARVIAKARRPSQHAAAMSPGKFSPGAPFSPSLDSHRPTSACSVGERSTPTSPRYSQPTPSPSPRYTQPPSSPSPRYTQPPSSPSPRYAQPPASPSTQPSADPPQYSVLENRAKIRTTSLEGSESDNSVRSMRSESDPGIADGQVAAISSTDPTPETISGLAEAFKPPSDPTEGGLGSPAVSLPNLPHNTQPHSLTDTQDKPVKKKRKRCGECTGCQRKDNCGDCAPCRNDKSHQICKMRRCDRLTEKKPRKSGTFTGEFASQTFTPQQTTPTWTPEVTPPEPAPWYPNSMGPPSNNAPNPPRSAAPPPATTITFDTAYNFSGQNHSILQEFFPLQETRPQPVMPLGRTPASAGGGGFLDQGYLGASHLSSSPGIPYHINVATDKSLLMTSSLGIGQGNYQPGYPTRPMEISQTYHRVTSSTGYPGDVRTGHPTPSPSHKHSTPLPSPAPSQPSPATPNDEHHVTSTRSPPTQEGGEPRYQEQEANVEARFTSAPVYTLLPPTTILPDPYNQKFGGLVSSQDSFYPLGFQ